MKRRNFIDYSHRHMWSVSVKSVDGNDLFITFTDYYSRYVYIYPIKERTEALDKCRYLRQKLKSNVI